MSKKTTIIVFYTAIAIICAGLLSGFIYWSKLYKEKAIIDGKIRKADRLEQMVIEERKKFSSYGIKDDLIGFDQSGKEKNFKEEFKGKVVVMAQFYAACPRCAVTNRQVLQEVMKKFGSDKDLLIVTVNVNEDLKSVGELKAYSESWGDNSPQWLFVKTDEDKFNKWANTNLGFGLFSRNTGELAKLEPVAHDMGIVVVGRDLVMVNKEDMDSPLRPRDGTTEEQRIASSNQRKLELFDSIERALKAK